MNKFTIPLAFTITSLALLTGCGADSKTKNKKITPPITKPTKPTPPTKPVNELSKLGIETKLPARFNSQFTKAFKRYTKVVAPNGKSIHILAQDKISINQILRARGILEHYLKDLPGSVYGADKSAIANKMADNNATLLLLNGKDDGKNPAGNLDGQPLYELEMQVEGHAWYINQNYQYRDAAFEEILHLVHDNGIGIDQGAEFRGAARPLQTEIRAAQQYALTNNIWGRGTDNKGWITELTAENSLSQEYLAALIDAYYGLWGAWKEGSGSMWGIYAAKERVDISKKDTRGHSLITSKFFHPHLTYNARIDADFKGTFSLLFDSNLPYTHHSQYLKDITLLGTNDNSVRLNQYDNFITGNGGSNTAFFTGKESDYTVSKLTNGNIQLTDNRQTDSQGKNILSLFENLQFSDVKREVKSL